jgi:hypothetical protein
VGSAIRGSASPRPHRPTASDRCGISHGVDHAAEDPQDVGLTGVLKGVTDVSPPRARRAGCRPRPPLSIRWSAPSCQTHQPIRWPKLKTRQESPIPAPMAGQTRAAPRRPSRSSLQIPPLSSHRAANKPAANASQSAVVPISHRRLSCSADIHAGSTKAGTIVFCRGLQPASEPSR